jgi:retron-type reverse transcriptase
MRGRNRNCRLLHDGHGRHARAIGNLVVPLAHEATDMRVKDTAGEMPGASCAVSPLIGNAFGEVTLNARTTAARLESEQRLDAEFQQRQPEQQPQGQQQPGSCCPQTTDYHADFSFEDLVLAYFDCRCTKRNSRSALAFEQHLEGNLRDLHDELKAGTYRPAPSVCFVITRPKPREVWAADFRDRIVHHLLYNRIAPRFERAFIADSCACIQGRGTLYAARRLESKIRSATENWARPAFYLKCDIANFFVAIDKRILRELLARKIHEPWWLALTELILFHDPRTDVLLHSHASRLALIPPHKSLFNQPEHLGLPIGNLSSQFFANVYMNELDQFVKHRLQARHYIRYVDDFVLLHESAQWLNAVRVEIEAFLPERLRLQLNPAKTVIQPIARGVDFVGQVVKPWRRITRRRTFNDALARTAAAMDEDLFETGNSYFGLCRQATHSHHDRARLASLIRHRGRSVNRALTQTYR